MVEGRARPSGLGNQKDRTDALQLLSIVHIGTSNLDAISPKESCSTHDFTKPFANVPDKLGSWKQYAGLISNMDHNIGRGLDALRSTGVADDTIVFFFNDNGAPEPGKSNVFDNSPLYGRKGSEYEGGVRVPYVMQWPGNPGRQHSATNLGNKIYP